MNAFEDLNANKSYICYEFTEVLRDLIRAVASVNNHEAVWRAVDHMQRTMRLVEKCKEDITWQDMFSHAVDALTDYEAQGRERQIFSTARDGMSLFTELTCDDGFAKGRISQREHTFLQNMKTIITWFDPPPSAPIRKKRTQR